MWQRLRRPIDLETESETTGRHAASAAHRSQAVSTTRRHLHHLNWQLKLGAVHKMPTQKIGRCDPPTFILIITCIYMLRYYGVELKSQFSRTLNNIHRVPGYLYIIQTQRLVLAPCAGVDENFAQHCIQFQQCCSCELSLISAAFVQPILVLKCLIIFLKALGYTCTQV